MRKHHWAKKTTLKNWKTGQILKFNSETEFCKKYGVPIQVCSDIVCGRRLYYREFSLPDFDPSCFEKYEVVDLKTGEHLKFKNVRAISRGLRIPTCAAERLVDVFGFRYKHYAHPAFNKWESIPQILNKSNGQISYIWHAADYAKKNKNISYKQLYYLIKQKRIAADDKRRVLGQKDYKYIVLNKRTGEKYKSLKLSQLAESMNLRKSKFYTKNKKFEVIEG